MTPDTAIQVRNISKVYKLYKNRADRLKEALSPIRKSYSENFYALRNISFDVLKGQTLGIVGKNGSGKSTLLQILCGILTPTTGSVLVDGKISALLELGTGFNPEFTGLENIYLNATIMGLSREEINNKLDSILSFADIGDFIHQPVKTYSSGMYVRLAFSVQANIDPEILIVDEALAVGDAQFVHRCMLRFHEMQEQGKTIILVTHDASSVKNLCNKALWINKGELKSIGDCTVVVDQYINELFKLEVREDGIKEEKKIEEHEEIILPTFDQRLGNGELEILGCAMYDEEERKISACNQEESILIKMTIKSNINEVEPIIGFILKDRRGIEIASTNSRTEKFIYPTIKLNQKMTVSAKLDIPRLFPGSYSITPTVSYMKDSEDVICDRLVNGLLLEVISDREQHILLGLKTSYGVSKI